MVVGDVLEAITILALMIVMLACFGKTWTMITRVGARLELVEEPLPPGAARFLIDNFTPSSGLWQSQLDEGDKINLAVLVARGYVEDGMLMAYPTERGINWLVQHGKS